MIIPDFGTVEGPFQVTAAWSIPATHNGEATYELSLASGRCAELRGDLIDMGNPWRGEAELTMDGRTQACVASLTLGALAELEQRTLQAEFAGGPGSSVSRAGPVPARDVLAVLRCRVEAAEARRSPCR